MDVTHDRLVEILRCRYDHYSAHAVLAEALEKEKIAVKPSYTAAEVEKIAEHLEARRDRTEQVVAYLRVEAKHVEAKHLEAKHLEAKHLEAKHVEAKPAEPKPAEAKSPPAQQPAKAPEKSATPPAPSAKRA